MRGLRLERNPTGSEAVDGAIAALCATAGCGAVTPTQGGGMTEGAGPRRIAPDDVALAPGYERQGQLVFMRHCNQCHPGGDAATGPAINNKPIPRAVMKLQIREAVLGTMPAFPESELSDAQVEATLDYMEALQDHER